MTIQFIDVPLPVCVWYAEKAPELHMTTVELMAHVLTLWPETGKAVHPKGAVTEAQDFPSGGGY